MRRSRKINAGRERGNEPKRENGTAGQNGRREMERSRETNAGRGDESKRGNGAAGRNGRREMKRSRKTNAGRERDGGTKRKYKQRNYECSGIKKQWLWGLKRAKIFWKSLLFLIYKYNLSIV